MAIRQIIEIDEAKCTGCGECAQGCPEGALRIIEGKARMVGESLCDGLGACIGTCPEGAITIVEREAEAYDEARVIEGIARLGPAVIAAHLSHLEGHGQDRYAAEARSWLAAHGIAEPQAAPHAHPAPAQASPGPAAAPGRFGLKPLGAPAFETCAGSAPRRPSPAAAASGEGLGAPSRLASWPVQLHLLNPRAPAYDGADLLVAADCTAYALGDFHAAFLAGRSLAIACPKLDQGREIYVEKLSFLLEAAASVTVLIMEVPCCSGLLRLLLEARESLGSPPPLRVLVVGIDGRILREETR